MVYLLDRLDFELGRDFCAAQGIILLHFSQLSSFLSLHP